MNYQQLLQLIKMFSKYSLLGIVLTCLFLNILLAGEGISQSRDLREVKISLNLHDVKLSEVFKTVENETGYSFAFDNEQDIANRVVSLKVKRESIYKLLLLLSEKANVKFMQVDEVINVAPYEVQDFKSQEPKVIIQTRNITGIVTSYEDGEGLPGVNVVEKGTSNGTVTNVNGEYSLEVSVGATLMFSSVGYTPEEVEVGNRSTIDLTMTQDIQQLQELVVIGYGSREKKDLTGSIAEISSKDITKQVTMSPELAMQGTMPGVFVSNPGSGPSARPEIRIRGVSTLGFNDPLYVIDGIPLTEGGASSSFGRDQDLRSPVNVFSMINPNDIESISVLKDASATAIYGVRASNGVILITTKRGSKGKPKVDVSANFGVQNIFKKYESVSMQEYIDFSLEAANNNLTFAPDQTFVLFDETSPEYLGNSRNYTQDWVDEAIISNAKIQDYNVSISGGNDMSNFALGAGFANQEDVIFSENFNRGSFYLNSDHQLTSWLKVGESYRLVYTKLKELYGGPDLGAEFGAPWQPIYDPNGPAGFAPVGRTYSGSFEEQGYGNSTRANILGNREFNREERDLLRNLGTFYAEISPLKGLTLKGTFSFDHYSNLRQEFTDDRAKAFDTKFGRAPGDGNGVLRRQSFNTNILTEFTIGYNRSFGKHNVDLILNAMDQSVSWKNISQGVGFLEDVPSWDQRRIPEGVPRENIGTFFERTPSGLQGYMARLSYNFDSKYYLDATVRRDGSSKFGPGYKWGTFPSLAAAWRVTSEPFMEQFSWLNDLKVRASWGQTGNQETRDFAFLSLVNLNPDVGFGSGDINTGVGGPNGNGILYPAATLGDFPIVDMSWETVTSTDIGFDALLLNNKVNVTFDYYHRLTEGILQEISIPLVIGALNQPVVNLAEVVNSGVELSAGYNGNLGDLNFNVTGNFTTVRNRVLSLYEDRPQGGNQSRIEVGRPMNFINGYKTDGIFRNDNEVTAWTEVYSDPGNDAQKAPGDVRFVDLFSAPDEDDPVNAIRGSGLDSVINVYDQTFLGKTIPGYYYGLVFNLDFKNWYMNINFRGVGDVQRVNRRGKESIRGFNENFDVIYRGRWTPENPNSNIPRAVHGDPSGNNRLSDRMVENAGFLRLQNLQIGYDFSNRNFLRNLNMSNLRLFVSGTNLFVLTPYTDLDPENNTTPTNFLVGANISF